MQIIALHGGLDTRREGRILKTLQRAATEGYRFLPESRIKALESALNVLEDSPYFNCGYGSVLNLNGEVEMDASIADGKTGRFSAVAAIRFIRNPVSVARAVMEKTGAVILAGDGALEFARKHGFRESIMFNGKTLEDYEPVNLRQLLRVH